MDAMTTYQRHEITQVRDISPDLFSEFVAWIDRSEKTTRTYIINLRQFWAWLRYTNTSRPAREDILSYRSWLLSEHEAIQFGQDSTTGWKYRTNSKGEPVKIRCSPSTAAQYLRSVCQFFRWTAANGLYPDIAANIHAPKIDHGKHKKEALTPAEVLQIEDSIAAKAHGKTEEAEGYRKDTAGRIQRSTEQGKRLYAMYLLAVNAGLRTVEISRADVKDLVTKGGNTWLYIWGKGHTEPDQKKPLAPEVAAAVRDYLQSRTDNPTGTSPLFVSTGNRSGGKRLATTTISTMLKQAMKQAGFDSERLTAHSLRHTAGTAVQDLTGDIYTTQKYMRHSNPATTEIYLHNDTERQEIAIARQLYDKYHGIEASTADRLQRAMSKLSPIQLEKLADIAEAMV